MTIQELIDELNKVKDKNSKVCVAVMLGEDQGHEQDHYEIFAAIEYDDGHVEIKC